MSYKKYILPAILGMLLFPPETSAIIPDRNYIRLPQDAGLIYRKLDVTTSDGLRIETWFYPAQDFPGESSGRQDMLPYRTIDEEKRPTLVICNGDAGNMSYQQIDLAMIYAACGFNVVTFDWRGFGASSEFEMNRDYLCYTEMLEDYRAVLDTVKGQEEVDGDCIFLMGWSTGAYLSMITAYNDENAAGCILSGVPSTFEEIIPILVRNHPAGKTEAELIVPEDFPKEQMPALIAPEFGKAIMIIVGSKDDRTPQWMAEKIYDALPEDTFKKLSIFENAGHGGTNAPYFVDTSRYVEETVTFMTEAPCFGG